MPGRLCNEKTNVCIDVNYITTTWTVEQVEQVITLSAVYPPYRIARIVHKRTYDTYQIVYHEDYFRRMIKFLTTPSAKVTCGNVEITANFISTNWDCETLANTIKLLLEGYSYQTVARRVHKRTADVKAIRDHLDYFIDILKQLRDAMPELPGILYYEDPAGVEHRSPFEVPGEWTVNELCQCYLNQTCQDYIMAFHKTNYLVVAYCYESKRGKVVTYDVAREIVEFYGLAGLIINFNEDLIFGIEEVDLPSTATPCDIDKIWWLLHSQLCKFGFV